LPSNDRESFDPLSARDQPGSAEKRETLSMKPSDRVSDRRAQPDSQPEVTGAGITEARDVNNSVQILSPRLASSPKLFDQIVEAFLLGFSPKGRIPQSDAEAEFRLQSYPARARLQRRGGNGDT
jgi:hypothetical protein